MKILCIIKLYLTQIMKNKEKMYTKSLFIPVFALSSCVRIMLQPVMRHCDLELIESADRFKKHNIINLFFNVL